MKCAEVMEWMHRYLDHDLSQEEMLEMFRHIDDCPSCAEVLDRLTMLSEQLEQLPEVKPPFSLVDSILPQLEQLDRGVREEPAVMEPEDPKVIPFTRSSTREKTPKGGSLAKRTGIGAAAAAVILLFAILKMPESIPGADMNMAYDKNSNEAASSSLRTGSAENSAPAAGQADSGGSGDVSSMDQVMPSDSADVNLKNTPPAPSENADTAAGAVSGPAMSKEPVVTEAPPLHKSTATSPPADSPRSSGQANTQSAGPKSTILSTPGQEIASDDKPAGDARIAPTPTPAEPEAFSLMAAETSWPSPDGRYTAELAGKQVVIYSSPAEGTGERVALTSLPVEGDWVSGEWSGDGSQFTYVSQLQDGTQATKVYTVPAELSAPVPTPTPVPSTSPEASAVPSPDSSPAVTPDAATSTK
ncbi:zf-HC2 domain-containing protein [Paenibacillus tritici]|uniref:Anti-sigma-W factor RsiW n=1 Tax=Paenibacillus tritici TaxID=1873425 RepID=A0ABX2DJ09_9BACL|nr:anti-sigma factor [Paenibacillus tritici]NQX44604.1 zf-HC2 domain-containing protein [Paenibacillus tritici]